MKSSAIVPGQLVIYDPGHTCEVGKVKRLNPYNPGTASVWYHTGDTVACTKIEDLYPVDTGFARRHKDMFKNAYALEEIINK